MARIRKAENSPRRNNTAFILHYLDWQPRLGYNGYRNDEKNRHDSK